MKNKTKELESLL